MSFSKVYFTSTALRAFKGKEIWGPLDEFVGLDASRAEGFVSGAAQQIRVTNE